MGVNDPMLYPGHAERLKGAVHVVLGAFALTAGLYNAGAWLSRRDRHLATNVAVYAMVMVYEARQVWRHLR
jgi:hypothetical protein